MPDERASNLSLLFESFVLSQRVSAVLEEAMTSSPISPLEYGDIQLGPRPNGDDSDRYG